MNKKLKWKLEEIIIWGAFILGVLFVLALMFYVVCRDYAVWKYILLK